MTARTPPPDRSAADEAAFAALLDRAGAVVDVRSPGEYAKGHVAGAVNIPLFSNDERAEIGTLYKLLGKQQAIDKGLGVLGAKLADFVRAFEPYRAAPLVIYCARGGMRSAAVVGLLSAIGFSVEQLPGGYKGFRNYLLARFETGLPPRLIVIHGQTGVGKTQILQRLANHLDLEDCAQHRSSVFGAINLQPRTQQQFDAELLAALGRMDFTRPVWVEGESRKIGDVLMPDALRRRMQASTCVLLTAALPTRVARIVAEYGRDDEATKAQWREALAALTMPLGRAAVAEMTARVDANDFAPVVERLLLDYYDARYQHAMRNYRYALTVDADDPDSAVASLETFAAGRGADTATPEAAPRPAAG